MLIRAFHSFALIDCLALHLLQRLGSAEYGDEGRLRHGLPDLATNVLRIFKLGDIDWQERHFAAVIEVLCQDDKLKGAFIALHVMRSADLESTDNTVSFLLDPMTHDVAALDSTLACINEIHLRKRFGR